jgi:hypothetical protein
MKKFISVIFLLLENIQSSPVSSEVERQELERAESPDLFATPRSNNEKEEVENFLL